MIAAAAVERGLFRNPTVTVTMNRRRTNQITVIGAVEKPGVYELPRGASNLLAAIVAADGLSKEAGTDVEIRRPAKIHSPESNAPDRVAGNAQLTGYTTPGPSLDGMPAMPQPVSYRIDLANAAKQGDGGQQLQDGDVVMIERRDPQPVHVIGLVMKPGQFELPVNQDMHVLDAIAQAGGVSINVAEKIHVLRRVPGKEQPAVIEVSYQDARAGGSSNLRLAPGDIVSVEDTPTTVFFESIRTFFRVGFTSALPGL
jgi:polysaccharide export outer membrane protein